MIRKQARRRYARIIECRIRALLDLGRVAEALDAAGPLAAGAPVHEPLQVLRIEALHRSPRPRGRPSGRGDRQIPAARPLRGPRAARRGGRRPWARRRPHAGPATLFTGLASCTLGDLDAAREGFAATAALTTTLGWTPWADAAARLEKAVDAPDAVELPLELCARAG